jgi:ATP-dependent helicase/nuclease subunit A
VSTFTDSQRRAIAARGNVLVPAGAGTGKTRTVVERCLRLISEGVSLENILMVTFTEAAAAEMRVRLRKALESWKDESNEPNGDSSKVRLSRPSQEFLAEQIALLDTAHISTLHSFCLQLVRNHFHELHIDPQVSVLDDSQSLPLMHETIEALLGRCYRGEPEFAGTVQKLIRQYGGGSDERIRALVLKLHRYAQSLPPNARWCERQLAQLDTSEPAHWRAWLTLIFRQWVDEWRPELERCTECDNIAACLRALAPTQIEPTLAQIREALTCVLAADKQTEWKRGDKGKFRDPVEKFFDEASFLRSLVEPREGKDPLLDDWNWMRAPMRALLLLTRDFTRQFTQAKRALGGVDFADLEQLSLRLLVNERDEPTEIARTWQAHFDYVFVDECQDINAAQEAILRAVSRDAGASNRFLVGDVKQSIYRFRLADPKIFRAYEEAWRNGESGQRIPLADNFRSREGILTFINPFFAALMRPAIGGVSYDGDAQLRFGNPVERSLLSAASQPGPRVELHVIHKVPAAENGATDENGADDDSNESEPVKSPVEDVLAIEKEARLVAKRLLELRATRHQIWDETLKVMRGVEWRDMVVLLRSPSSRVETFAKEFSRAGVPLAAARAGFYSAMEVLDLLNLLRLLDNPLQDLPLVSVLRSPLVGLSPDELAAVRINTEGRSPFFIAVNRMVVKATADSETQFHQSARAKLKKYFTEFARWRALARQTSISHCLETVLADTHYEALLLAGARGRERVANVNQLLELAREYDPFQRQGLHRFLRFVDEQQDAKLDHEGAVVETGNAVQLMSIHKSKGLEFPVVVLPCLAGRFNTQDLREDILLSADYGLCAKIIPPHAERRYPSLPWWLAKRRETRELLGEEMRLLYVAMTRARDTLLLTAFDKSTLAGARWHADGAMTFDDREMTRDTSYFAWLRRWLSTVTSDENWIDERSGTTALLRWELHPEDASEFARTIVKGVQAEIKNKVDEVFDLEPLRRRLTWQYVFAPVTKEPAKTNVSLLRRRAADEEARQLFRPRRRASTQLSAADIGSAHHLFLQYVDLARAESLVDLRNEAERLIKQQLISSAQAAALDFEALLRFWQSTEGRKVRAQPSFVHRELPFTARFTLQQLAELGLSTSAAPDEFVIVQGVVDLAVLRDESISIFDFKTDAFPRAHLESKVREYEPQLRLYASALSRIYGRKVEELALHFLALGETWPISVQ